MLLTDQKMEELLDSVDSKNTTKVIRYARHKLERFCSLVGMDIESLHQLPTTELDNLLSRFLGSLRKDDGTLYKKKSLQSISFGVNSERIICNSSCCLTFNMARCKIIQRYLGTTAISKKELSNLHYIN